METGDLPVIASRGCLSLLGEGVEKGEIVECLPDELLAALENGHLDVAEKMVELYNPERDDIEDFLFAIELNSKAEICAAESYAELKRKLPILRLGGAALGWLENHPELIVSEPDEILCCRVARTFALQGTPYKFMPNDLSGWLLRNFRPCLSWAFFANGRERRRAAV